MARKARRIVYDMVKRWSYLCICGKYQDGFETEHEAELAHDVHWVGCKENR